MVPLVFDMEKCVACRTCEIACSYHHKKLFNPGIASLRIRTIEEWPKISIAHYRDQPSQEMGSHLPCDGCQGESIALCVKYCPVGAIEMKKQGVHPHG